MNKIDKILLDYAIEHKQKVLVWDHIDDGKEERYLLCYSKHHALCVVYLEEQIFFNDFRTNVYCWDHVEPIKNEIIRAFEAGEEIIGISEIYNEIKLKYSDNKILYKSKYVTDIELEKELIIKLHEHPENWEIVKGDTCNTCKGNRYIEAYDTKQTEQCPSCHRTGIIKDNIGEGMVRESFCKCQRKQMTIADITPDMLFRIIAGDYKEIYRVYMIDDKLVYLFSAREKTAAPDIDLLQKYWQYWNTETKAWEDFV